MNDFATRQGLIPLSDWPGLAPPLSHRFWNHSGNLLAPPFFLPNSMNTGLSVPFYFIFR